MRVPLLLLLIALGAGGIALAWTGREDARGERSPATAGAGGRGLDERSLTMGRVVGERGRDARPEAGAAQARPEAAPRPEPRRGPRGGTGLAPAVDRAIAWRRSRALGTHAAGRLERGVRLPAAGRHFVTWDPVRRRTPNRAWRRWGTDRLVRTVLRVLRRYRHAHPDAPRVAVGDLSRPRGGDFGRRFGPIGHASHQNGLDVDVYYPRRDGLERKPFRPAQVDRRLAQDLVDRFVAAGAERVFVGPSLGLRGPARVVQPLVHHDDHLHLRLPL